MTDQDKRRDEELAAFTDALLNKEGTDEARRPPLANTVETLARTLGHQSPPTHLRSRVRRCVAAEWPKPRVSLGQRLRNLAGPFGQPRYRWAWATVAALVVLAIGVTLLLPMGPGETTGTLVGEIDTTTLVIVLSLMLVVGIVAAWLFSRRR